MIGYGHHPLFLYLEPIMEQKDYLDRACDSFRKWTVLAVNEELGLLLLKDGNRVMSLMVLAPILCHTTYTWRNKSFTAI